MSSPTPSTNGTFRFQVPAEWRGPAWAELVSQVDAALARGTAGVEIDLNAVRAIQGIEAGIICEVLRRARRAEVPARLVSPSDEVVRMLRVFRIDRLIEEADDGADKRREAGLIERLGRGSLGVVEQVGEMARLGWDAAYWTVIGPFKGQGVRLKAIWEQLARAGTEALPVVALIAALMGVVLAINAAHQLKPFGALIFVADLVGLSLTREIGPLVTAFLVAGRSGAEMAAELGTMRVTEEIDAMETMGLKPGRFLVAPRLLALMAALPCLVLFADFIGVLAGYAVAVYAYEVSPTHYLDRTLYAIQLGDVFTGLYKSVFFALAIGLIGCHRGLTVTGGAAGVGRSATSAVVVSIFCVILTNTLVAVFVYML